jgi:hypothetical protein
MTSKFGAMDRLAIQGVCFAIGAAVNQLHNQGIINLSNRALGMSADQMGAVVHDAVLTGLERLEKFADENPYPLKT